MGPANRGGTEDRQTHRDCRGRASFLRTAQRDRAVVTSLGRTHRAGITASPPATLGSTEARVEGLIRINKLEPLISFVAKIMKLFITIITSVVCSVAAVAAPQEQASQNPPPLDASSRDSSVKPGD